MKITSRATSATLRRSQSPRRVATSNLAMPRIDRKRRTTWRTIVSPSSRVLSGRSMALARWEYKKYRYTYAGHAYPQFRWTRWARWARWTRWTRWRVPATSIFAHHFYKQFFHFYIIIRITYKRMHTTAYVLASRESTTKKVGRRPFSCPIIFMHFHSQNIYAWIKEAINDQ